MTKPILEMKNVYFGYSSELILNSVSFSIEKGSLVAIVGPNGSGKSTLVKVLSGLLKKQKGRIKRYGKIAYIPQKFNQDQNFPATVEELLNLECCNCSLRENVISSLRLKNFENKQFRNLSGGQQQRVYVALALLSNPDILILDEPTVGIDTKTQEEFYSLLKHLNEENNLTILFVTHDTGMISTYFTTILCVNNGNVEIDDAKHTRTLLHKTYGESFQELHHLHEDSTQSGFKAMKNSETESKESTKGGRKK